MPFLITVHQLRDLSHEESKDQILLDTNINTQINIQSKSDCTIISLPYGNRFDIISGNIIIHEK